MKHSAAVLLLAITLLLASATALSDSYSGAIDDCKPLESGKSGHLESLPPGSINPLAPCLWLTSTSGRRVLGAEGAGANWRKGAELIAAPQLRMLPPEHQRVVWLFDVHAARERWKEHRRQSRGQKVIGRGDCHVAVTSCCSRNSGRWCELPSAFVRADGIAPNAPNQKNRKFGHLFLRLELRQGLTEMQVVAFLSNVPQMLAAAAAAAEAACMCALPPADAARVHTSLADDEYDALRAAYSGFYCAVHPPPSAPASPPDAEEEEAVDDLEDDEDADDPDWTPAADWIDEDDEDLDEEDREEDREEEGVDCCAEACRVEGGFEAEIS